MDRSDFQFFTSINIRSTSFFLHTTTIFTIFSYEFPTYFYIMDLFESSSDDDDIFITMMYEYYANELQEKMKPLYEQEAWG